MQENMKQSSHSFLQKFKGKTSKVSKQGIGHLLKQKLQPIQKQIQYKSLQSSRQLNEANQKDKIYNRTPILAQNDKSIQAKRLAADMEQLFSVNPEFAKGRRIMLKKMNPQNQSLINAQDISYNSVQKKQRFLPPLYTPQKSDKRTIYSNSKSFIDSTGNLRTDSQHGSIKSQKKSKYVFGKYLKLDDDAMKHFQFLKNIEKKSLLKNIKDNQIVSR